MADEGAGADGHTAAAPTQLHVGLRDRELPVGERVELAFRIVGPDGAAVTDFDLEHERRMHLIVVRRDLTGFQHLHPDMDEQGVWSTPITFESSGEYRVFADFSHDGKSLTVAANCTVKGEPDYQDLQEEQAETETDLGYRVALAGHPARAGEATELSFEVSHDGETVQVEPYLGADGHLVALREGDLAFLHVHPIGGRGSHGHHHGHSEHATDDAGGGIRFMTEFPSEGRYRLFLQFQHRGKVHTAAFTREVTGD